MRHNMALQPLLAQTLLFMIDCVYMCVNACIQKTIVHTDRHACVYLYIQSYIQTHQTSQKHAGIKICNTCSHTSRHLYACLNRCT